MTRHKVHIQLKLSKENNKWAEGGHICLLRGNVNGYPSAKGPWPGNNFYDNPETEHSSTSRRKTIYGLE